MSTFSFLFSYISYTLVLCNFLPYNVSGFTTTLHVFSWFNRFWLFLKYIFCSVSCCSNCYVFIRTSFRYIFSFREYGWGRSKKQRVCFWYLESKFSLFCLSPSVFHSLSSCSLFILVPFHCIFFFFLSYISFEGECRASIVIRARRQPSDAVTPGNGWTCPQCIRAASRGTSDCAAGCDGDGMRCRGRGMGGVGERVRGNNNNREEQVRVIRGRKQRKGAEEETMASARERGWMRVWNDLWLLLWLLSVWFINLTFLLLLLLSWPLL